MKRASILIGLMGLAAMALAFSTFTKTFHDHYDIKKGSTLDKAACMTCHVGVKGGKLNAYGKDLQVELKAIKSKKLTPVVLDKVEGLDSDKDGMKNLDEIKKDRNPGIADKD